MHEILCEGIVFKFEVVTAPLCCETKRKAFSEVTGGFNDEFTPTPLSSASDLTGSNYRFSRCLLSPPACSDNSDVGIDK